MKFNEKLMELRRKAGLSQEELGYKLNVTRQTVSKWELGTTKPEMDKLVEIGKLFNISVDELINESEVISEKNTVIEDQPINSTKKSNATGNKVAKVIIIIVVLLVLSGFAVSFIIWNSFMNFFETTTDYITQGDNVSDVVDIENEDNFFVRIFKKLFGKSYSMMEETEKEFEETKKQMERDSFNSSIEIHTGTKFGGIAKNVIDTIITNNKTQSKKIIVKYNDIETENTEEMKNLKLSLDDFTKYELSCEYDEDGYIYMVLIEDIKTEGNNIGDDSYTNSTSTTTVNNGTTTHTTTSSSSTTSSSTSSSSSSTSGTVKNTQTQQDIQEQMQQMQNQMNDPQFQQQMQEQMQQMQSQMNDPQFQQQIQQQMQQAQDMLKNY